MNEMLPPELEKPTQKALARWLEARDKLQLIGIVLGVLISMGTVVSFFIGIGVRLAAEDFVTTQAARELELRIREHVTQELNNRERLQSVKDEATALQIARMAEDNRTANQNIEAKLNEFTRTLIQWSRGR